MHNTLHLGQRRAADSSHVWARSLGAGKVLVMNGVTGCNSFRKWQQFLKSMLNHLNSIQL